jgi:hypothetical protein
MTWGVTISKPDQQKQQVKSIAGQVPDFQKVASEKVEVEPHKMYASTRAYVCAGTILSYT